MGDSLTRSVAVQGILEVAGVDESLVRSAPKPDIHTKVVADNIHPLARAAKMVHERVGARDGFSILNAK